MEEKGIKNGATLQRTLSPMHVWAIAFGCIVGWGSFINPGKKFLPNSGVAGTAIAMALGAVVMIIIAFSYAYMVPKYPKAGGEFTFAKACFGKRIAFICGWFLIAAYLTNVPMDSTAIGLVVDGLDGDADILKFGFHYTVAGFDIYLGEMLLIAAILLLFGYLNIVGVKKAGFVQTVLSSLLVVCVLVLCIAGFTSAKAQGINMEPIWGFDKSAAMAANATTAEIGQFAHKGAAGIVSAILATFAIAPWAYVGFDSIPQAAEELLGNFGKVLIGVGVSCAVLSGIMGFYLAASRLMYSMAREGYLPAVFGKIDSRYGTPRNAIVFCIVVSMSGPILGREALGWFVDMSAIGASIGYLFTCASTLVTLRKDHDGTMFLKIMAAVGVIFSLSFMVLQLIPIPGLSGVHFCKESYFMLIVWTVVGLLFYIKQRKFFVS